MPETLNLIYITFWFGHLLASLTFWKSEPKKSGSMSGEGRRAKRQIVCHSSMIYGMDGARIAPCTLKNVSVGGAQLELQREVNLPKTFLLSLSENGQVRRRCKIVWQFATVIGVCFMRD
jgi:hypothetical protein